MTQVFDSDDTTLADRMVAAARELQDEADPQRTMEAAVHLAASNISHCDAACITLVRRRHRLETTAFTDEVALLGDELQYELGEGPCVDAAWEERIVHSADLRSESRWPIWAARMAREHGTRSMLCLQLFTHGDRLGALNLYSRRPGAFTVVDRDDGLALAAHVAVAVAAALEIEQLSDALDSRTLIAQACGILMERHGLEAHRAFEVLARVSSQTNTKLRDLARELVETRELPAS